MQEPKFKTIKDVEFFYTSVSYPQKQQNSDNKPPLSDHPLEFHSYEIKICLPESRYKQLKKAFPKAKNFPNAKEFTPEEYVKKLCKGMENVEEPDEDMYLIKFAQAALIGLPGNRKPSRKIKQIGVRGGMQDRNGETIDWETRIGNGSKGHFQFKPVETRHGLYLYPIALCITELVPWDGGGFGYDEEAFGIEEINNKEETPTETPKVEVEEEFDTDDIPF